MSLTNLPVAIKNYLPADEQFIECIQDILTNPVAIEMHKYIQHGNTTCLMHCIAVSYRSYCTARRLGLDYKSTARAGLLHDLFLYDWHDVRLKDLHGFKHPAAALQNAANNFELNNIERNIILRHMWPLTIVPPKHAEGFIIVWYDKLCGLLEVFRRPCFAK